MRPKIPYRLVTWYGIRARFESEWLTGLNNIITRNSLFTNTFTVLSSSSTTLISTTTPTSWRLCSYFCIQTYLRIAETIVTFRRCLSCHTCWLVVFPRNEWLLVDHHACFKNRKASNISTITLYKDHNIIWSHHCSKLRNSPVVKTYPQYRNESTGYRGHTYIHGEQTGKQELCKTISLGAA